MKFKGEVILAEKGKNPKTELEISDGMIMILFDHYIHVMFSQDEFVGLQSWVQGTYSPLIYKIEIYTKCGNNILLEYDTKEKWQNVLSLFDEVSLLKKYQ